VSAEKLLRLKFCFSVCALRCVPDSVCVLGIVDSCFVVTVNLVKRDARAHDHTRTDEERYGNSKGVTVVGDCRRRSGHSCDT